MLCHGPEMSNVSAIGRLFRSSSPCNTQLIALHSFLSSRDRLVDDVDGETREQVDCSVDWREWPTVGTWPPLNRPARTSRKYTSTDVRRTNNPCVIEEMRQSLERGMGVHRVGFCWMLARVVMCFFAGAMSLCVHFVKSKLRLARHRSRMAACTNVKREAVARALRGTHHSVVSSLWNQEQLRLARSRYKLMVPVYASRGRPPTDAYLPTGYLGNVSHHHTSMTEVSIEDASASRFDGHGRVIPHCLRNRTPGVNEVVPSQGRGGLRVANVSKFARSRSHFQC